MDLGGGVRVYVTFPGLARLPSPPRVNVFLGLVREVQSSPRFSDVDVLGFFKTLSMFRPSQCLALRPTAASLIGT